MKTIELDAEMILAIRVGIDSLSNTDEWPDDMTEKQINAVLNGQNKLTKLLKQK